jgi:hypothetical protein
LKNLLGLYFALFISQFSFAQADSCNLRISLLTCAPGEEIYATFGHTALRVLDQNTGADLIFNYGTFEFTPDFNVKFIRGKLLYSLSVEEFNDFLYTYQQESRSVQEQVLQLSCAEKQKLFAALRINALEQNRYYRYDFLFDNCTTRAGDIVVQNTEAPVVFKNILPEKIPTFRDLIHSYLEAGHEHWSKLGIDILLGARLDRKVSNRQAMFLPDYLMKGFDNAATGGHPLCAPSRTILGLPSPLREKSWFTPGLVFSLLLVLIMALAFINSAWAKKALTIFDFLFFFVLGCAGLLMLFMWFGTDHKVCRDNFNLFWALPTHIVMAFFVHSEKEWTKKYFRAVFWISILLAAAWFFLPQQMNPALIPVLLLILYRSWDLSKTNRYASGIYHP